jgi:catechol 2,3-dioxygenase-like lactoylglutathione lyase family enzyme
VDHAGFVVSDLDRAIGFWCRALGLEVLWRLEDDGPELRRQVGFPDARIRIAHLGVPGCEQKIELLEYVAPPVHGSAVPRNHVGAAHVCFVVDDVQAEYRRLRAAGVDSFVSEPVRFLDGPDAGALAVYLRDPDGNTIELAQEPPGKGVR